MDESVNDGGTVDFRQVPLSLAVKKYKDHYPPPYPGLILDVPRQPGDLDLWTIYTYADNTHSFSDARRESLWLWLKGLLDWLNHISAFGAVQTEELETTP